MRVVRRGCWLEVSGQVGVGPGESLLYGGTTLE